MKASLGLLLVAHELPYPLQRLPNEDAMVKNRELGSLLMAIDPRGGFFKQDDIKGGIELLAEVDTEIVTCIDAIETKVTEAKKLLEPQGREATLNQIAYSLRLMCRHYRAKQRQTPDSKALECVFQVMAPVRLKSKASGLFHMIDGDQDDGEQAEEEDGDEDEDGADAIVSTYFDGHLMQGFQLLDTGELRPALWYEKGARGLVVCIFEDNVEFETEVPNRFLIAGRFGQVPIVAPPGKRPKISKKPAGNEATAIDLEAAGADAVEVASSGAEEQNTASSGAAKVATAGPKHNKPMRLTLVRCHAEDKFGIHLVTQCTDRAQLVEFWGRNKEQDFLDTVNKILDDSLQPIKHLRVKCIPSDVLGSMRKLCRQARDEFPFD